MQTLAATHTSLQQCNCAFSSYPLRFVTPSRASSSRVDCLWVYVINYGGGLVAGDHISMHCEVGSGGTALLTTQGTTKVFKVREGGNNPLHQCSSQMFRAVVAAYGTLILLPEPYTCFRGAKHKQSQIVELAAHANLVLVDLITCGRLSRSERWMFNRLQSTTEIRMQGQLLLLEPLLLEDEPGYTVASRMGPITCLGLLAVVGERMHDLIGRIKCGQERPSFHCWRNQFQQRYSPFAAECVMSICLLSHGGIVLKLGGRTTESVYGVLQEVLRPLENDIIGGPVPYTG